MARLRSSSLSCSFASSIILVPSIRILSFSLSESFSSSFFFSLSFLCSSRAFASASSLLILGFSGGGGAGFSSGRSMSASSACSASQFTACSMPALSVLYRAFSDLTSSKPISMTCFSRSWLTFSLISGGLGSPAFLSSGASAMTTSASASAIATSPEPEACASSAASTNSSVSLSRSASPACSASHASAASRVPLSFVKCRAFAERVLPWALTCESVSSFFWSTEAKNLSFLIATRSFFFCSSIR
mmetsp:Transcript_26579/g.75072  ORF Transcript_26579/g.75072 Transcript_26579/m.75072 type:complete len:246 (-) Transcript_26579:359-1096(-)